MDRDEPVTEARASEAADLDLRTTLELVELMNREDATVPAAVAGARGDVAAVVDEIVERLGRGGRLVLAGAGTSGRLAQAEAAECRATFSSEAVLAVAANADASEDDEGAGRDEVARLVLADDVVVLVSASGRTPFVLGAARAAAASGAFTACIVSAPDSELADLCDRAITVVVGPELLAGSTRLKAGTAQKLVLNTLTTVAMIRLGKTFGNLMVDVSPANEKLRGRVRRIVQEATGAPGDAVEDALAEAGGDAKVAIVALVAGVDADAARAKLTAAGGNIRLALIP